jgi:Uma2 family endonuclease
VRNLALALGRFLEEHPLGELFFAPIDLVLPAGLASPVQPDLVFVGRERQEIVQETSIAGVPHLVAEVLSPGNWLTDRRDKLAAYAEAGIAEYWILDPRQRTVEVYGLGGSAYELLGTFRPGERARSRVVPGFEPAVEALLPA